VVTASSNDWRGSGAGGGDGEGVADGVETARAARGAERVVESSTRVSGTHPVLSAPRASNALLTSLLDIGPVFIIERLS